MSEVIELPEFESALVRSIKALQRLAGYELEPAIQHRMRDLGERKETLDKGEHAELMSLVTFSEQRTIERLEARVALKDLQAFVPELIEAS